MSIFDKSISDIVMGITDDIREWRQHSQSIKEDRQAYRNKILKKENSKLKKRVQYLTHRLEMFEQKTGVNVSEETKEMLKIIDSIKT